MSEVSITYQGLWGHRVACSKCGYRKSHTFAETALADYRTHRCNHSSSHTGLYEGP